MALGKIRNPETLQKLICNWKINIYDPDIFVLARKLAVRYSREKLSFIPVYPKLVRYSSIATKVNRLTRKIASEIWLLFLILRN